MSENASCTLRHEVERARKLCGALESIVAVIVEHPNMLSVESRENAIGQTVIQVRVWRGDLSRLVGVNGTVAGAICE